MGTRQNRIDEKVTTVRKALDKELRRRRYTPEFWVDLVYDSHARRVKLDLRFNTEKLGEFAFGTHLINEPQELVVAILQQDAWIEIVNQNPMVSDNLKGKLLRGEHNLRQEKAIAKYLRDQLETLNFKVNALEVRYFTGTNLYVVTVATQDQAERKVNLYNLPWDQDPGLTAIQIWEHPEWKKYRKSLDALRYTTLDQIRDALASFVRSNYGLGQRAFDLRLNLSEDYRTIEGIRYLGGSTFKISVPVAQIQNLRANDAALVIARSQGFRETIVFELGRKEQTPLNEADFWAFLESVRWGLEQVVVRDYPFLRGDFNTRADLNPSNGALTISCRGENFYAYVRRPAVNYDVNLIIKEIVSQDNWQIFFRQFNLPEPPKPVLVAAAAPLSRKRLIRDDL